MPRSGDVYSLPAGSIVVNGTTIDASQHNTPLNDIAADLNAARPIVAGGTGATTAAGALTNLGVTATAAELNFVDGVTSNIQTQIDAKLDTADLASVAADIVPDADSTRDLGSSTIAWALAYLDAIEPVGTDTTIKRVGGTNTTPIVEGIAKAWINFNGTGTIAARDSYGFSSLVDDGAGDYTGNLTIAMGSANYSALVGGYNSGLSIGAGVSFGPLTVTDLLTTTAISIQTRAYTGTSNTTFLFDSDNVYLGVIGDLA